MYRTTIAVTIALLGSLGNASAQTLIVDEAVADREPTGVSGTSGKEVRVGFKNGVAYEIRWSERDDEPCWFRVTGVNMSGGDTEKVSRTWEKCNYKHHSSKWVEFGEATDDAYRVIRGVQVCTNKKGTRMKGLKLWPARLDLETGDVTKDGSSPLKATRNHCDDWHKQRFCPAGEVATGFILQVRERSEISGIALECSKVRVSKPMKRPKQ